MRVTVTGRPSRIEKRHDCLALTLDRDGSIHVASGETKPPNEAPCIVFILERHYQRVRDALRDPDDVLIVEGSGVIEHAAFLVYASIVTTRTLQARASARHRPL